jgi:hypothetical protein
MQEKDVEKKRVQNTDKIRVADHNVEKGGETLGDKVDKDTRYERLLHALYLT